MDDAPALDILHLIVVIERPPVVRWWRHVGRAVERLGRDERRVNPKGGLDRIVEVVIGVEAACFEEWLERLGNLGTCADLAAALERDGEGWRGMERTSRH
jgi:hypothetical protein